MEFAYKVESCDLSQDTSSSNGGPGVYPDVLDHVDVDLIPGKTDQLSENIRMSTMNSSLDIVRAGVGVDGGPDLVEAVQGARLPQIDALAEQMLAANITPRGEAPHNEVWPVISARAGVMRTGGDAFAGTMGPAGISVFDAVDPRRTGTNHFSTGVVRALLYSHGLIIEDPIMMAADMHLSSPAELRHVSRRFIEAATMSLVEVEQLVDAKIVETYFNGHSTDRTSADVLAAEMLVAVGSVDSTDKIWSAFESDYVDSLHPALRILWRQVRAGDKSPSMNLVKAALKDGNSEQVQTFVNVLAELDSGAVVRNLIDTVAHTLDDIRILGGTYDVLATSQVFADLLFLGSKDPAQQMRVHQLAQVTVPRLDELAMSDVVSIRSTSDAYATWRARLSLGLERAMRLRDELGPGVDLAAAVDEVLVDAREEMLRETKASAVLGPRGTMGFVAGALGGAIGGAAGGPMAGLLGAAGGVIPALAQGLINARTPVPDFVQRHYVVFGASDT